MVSLRRFGISSAVWFSLACALGISGCGGEASTPEADAEAGAAGLPSQTSGGAPGRSGQAAAGDATDGGSPAAGTLGIAGAPSHDPPLQKTWIQRGAFVLEREIFTRTIDTLLKRSSGVSPQQDLWLFPVGDYTDLTPDRRAVTDALGTVTDAELLSVLGCESASSACIEPALTRWIGRAWHRPSEAADIAVFSTQLSAAPANEKLAALREILKEVLSSPRAIIVPQLGEETAPGIYVLDAYDRANLLAYGMTGAPPDDLLIQSAETGTILAPAELRSQAERLLATPQGADRFEYLVRRWLQIPSEGYYQFMRGRPDPALLNSIERETRLFLEEVVLRQNAPVGRLLTADFTFADESLASLYGVELGPSHDADGFARVDLSATPRRGLLHQANWLASQVNYGERGARSLRLLCEDIPAPPPGAVFPEVPESAKTQQERFAAFTSAAECQLCHSILNPLGFAFGHFDEMGAFRETDNGAPIPTSGRVRSFSDKDFEFDSSTALVQRIAERPELQRCYAERLVEGWVGLGYDDAAAADYAARWAATGAELGSRDAIFAWIGSEHFFTRRDITRP